jgi:hypothetical protein
MGDAPWMISENKFYLLALHKEIDFFDRKIAHARNIESFDSDHLKTLAIKKLETKRSALVTTAMDLASKGVAAAIFQGNTGEVGCGKDSRLENVVILRRASKRRTGNEDLRRKLRFWFD